MANTSQSKQYALVEACRKAGIHVIPRESASDFSEIILTDECGRKYKVGKDLKVKPVQIQRQGVFKQDVRVALPEYGYEVTAYNKGIPSGIRRGKIKLVKSRKRTNKFGKAGR